MDNKIFYQVVLYILGSIFTICGFIVKNSYDAISVQLKELNAEMVSMKLKLVQIEAFSIDEAKVKEIVRNEMKILKQ